MAEKLVILSDMWGVKKGLWITSYLGYLQQYYDMVFYDCQDLARIRTEVESKENIHAEFVNGGIETAVAHLLVKEQEPSHYLAFSTGGAIAWKAALRGLPAKSLYAISATRIRLENEGPQCPVTLLYGKNDSDRPSANWAVPKHTKVDVVPKFGHDMYTDEKIIKRVSKDLLDMVMAKQI